MPIKVKLRQKLISKGRESLYLDFYPHIVDIQTGKKTRREFLSLYITLNKKELKEQITKHQSSIKEKKAKGEETEDAEKSLSKLELHLKTFKGLKPKDKNINNENKALANSILAERQNRLNKPEIYTQQEKEALEIIKKGEQCFLTYIKKLAKKRNPSNQSNWNSAIYYLTEFTKGELKFKDLSEELLENFKEYLLNTQSRKSKKVKLSNNSAVSYFNKIKATLKQAYKDKIIQTNLNELITPIKEEETVKEYLTLEEVNQLIKTPLNNSLLKRVCIFSILTGLRFSDIKKLTWAEIELKENDGYTITFNHQKTKNLDYTPISDQAYKMTYGEINPKDMPQHNTVFENLKYSAHQNKEIADWIKSAGITKKITFHNFRHTYATIQLFNGTDIYTVSKMLGHKNIKTTQIYAKVVNEAKRNATKSFEVDNLDNI